MHNPYRRPSLHRTARRSALLLTLLCALAVCPPVRAQSDPVLERLAQMTTAEKVGQLFVIAFWGRNPSPSSRAGKLIQESNVGGVVLLSSNLNIVNQGTDTLADVTRLSNTLQDMAMAEAGPGIPLLISIDHEGDGYPLTRITSGTTPKTNDNAVMRIGRNRRRAATTAESTIEWPCSWCCLANSIRRMAVLLARPINSTRPIWV